MKNYSFFVVVASLYIFGCGIPSPLRTTLQREELAISPPDKPKVYVHPVTNPVPVDRGEFNETEANRQEIPAEEFLVARAHQGQINTMTVTDDGFTAFSGGHDGKVVKTTLQKSPVRESQSEGLIAERSLRSETILISRKPILALALSPDESKLAVSQFSTVVVFDLVQRKIVNKLTRVKGRILAVAWDPRGELVALGRANGDVFIWNVARGSFPGEDSLEAVERYGTGSSPVVSLIFHPSARAFFSAERDGAIYLWRLLRTDAEMGLRDLEAVDDQKNEGTTQTRVATLSTQIEDVWLNREATVLLATASDGEIYRWKIRGLKEVEKISVGIDSVFSLQGVKLQPLSGAGVQLLAISGKGQRLKFWCSNPQPAAAEEQGAAAVTIIKTAVSKEPERKEQADDAPLMAGSGDSAAGAETAEPVQGAVALKPGFVAESVVLRSPINIVRAGRRSSLLWAAEKTGNLLTFDANSLLKSPLWIARAELCED